MANMKNSDRKVEIDLLQYWNVLWKRKWIILSTLAILVALSAVISFTTAPQYEAMASLLIEDPGSNKLNLQDYLNAATGTSSDFMGTYFNTQLKIIQSRTLAERVAKKMNLAGRTELQETWAPKKNLFQLAKSVLSFRWLVGSKSASGAPRDSAPSPAEADAQYAALILRKLRVMHVAETSLVEVSFTSPFPRLAADIVNSLSEEFINFSIMSKYEATQQTSEFLNEQIAQLRDDLGTKERELQKYREEKKILPLNEKENTVVAKYGDLQKAATEAQVARIDAQSKYRELKNLQVDSLPQLIGNPLIQSLKTSYVQLKNEYDEKTKTTYKPDHPDMIQLKARRDGTKMQLEAEIRKAVDAAEQVYRTVLDKELSFKKSIEDQRQDVTKLNSASILAKSLEIDVSTLQNLLNTLVAKQSETQVSARLSGLKTSNIKVVDRALIPERPVSPNVPRNFIVALLLGLMLGVGAAVMADFLDNTVKGPEDLEKLTGLPSLGSIPHFSPNGVKANGNYSSLYGAVYGSNAAGTGSELSKISDIELINLLFPKISIAEDYRAVRTSILFARAERKSRVIAFTSTSPREGKSATIANMSVSFAQMGERVLTIDADLRKPRLHKIFKVPNRVGLSDFLTGRASLDEAVQKTAIEHFWLMPSGPHPPNPAELLNSKKMKELIGLVRAKFDIVLIDLPPVLAVIDPVIVSSMADMTILVLKTGKTTRKPLQKTVEELKKGKADIVGVIFNDDKSRTKGHYSPYFQYEYYQDKSVEDGQAKTSADKGQ